MRISGRHTELQLKTKVGEWRVRRSHYPAVPLEQVGVFHRIETDLAKRIIETHGTTQRLRVQGLTGRTTVTDLHQLAKLFLQAMHC